MRLTNFEKDQEKDKIEEVKQQIMQNTCDKCQFKKRYNTGRDEYPAYTTIEYCSKEHWEGGDMPSVEDIDNWSNCVDFLPRT